MTKAAAFLVGAVVSLVPAAAAVVFYINPLTRKRRAVGATGDLVDAEGYIKITSSDAVPADGVPRSFKVVADLQDFWNKFPNSEIGSVYLRRLEDDSLQCFTSRCPHLGCTVSYDEGSQKYLCPCHESAFTIDGERSNNIPPRNMDKLETRVDDAGAIWVKFVKFRAGSKDAEIA
jgi:Rieske Fe-S protein